MSRRLASAAFTVAALCWCHPAAADFVGTAYAADISSLSRPEAIALLDDLVWGTVASANCTDYGLSDADHQRLSLTSDAIAAALGITDAGVFDEIYYKPAFAAIEADQTGFCAEYGPRLSGILERLTQLGDVKTKSK